MAVRTITGVKKGTADPVGEVVSLGNIEFSVTDSDGTEIGTAVLNVVEISDNDITINGATFESIKAEENTDIVVKDTNGDPVGIKTGLEWIVPAASGPCSDGTATIKDSEGIDLYTVIVPSGGNTNQTITDSTAIVRRSDLSEIVSELIKAQDSENIDIADSTITLKKSDDSELREIDIMAASLLDETIGDSTVNVKKTGGALISAEAVMVETSKDYTVIDSTVKLYLSNGLTLLRDVIVKAADTVSETIAKATVNIKKSDGTTIQSPTVEAEATEDSTVADSAVVLKKSNGTTTIRSVDVMAATSKNEIIAKATVNINKAGGGLIAAQEVEAEETESYAVAVSPITVNTVSMDDVEATETGAFEVVDAADGVTLVGSKLSGTKWEVVISGGSLPISYNRPQSWMTPSYYTYDSAWHQNAGTYEYDVEGVKPILDTYYLLDAKTPNVNGRLQRFEGKTGGYYEPSDNTWRDVNGVVTTEALAFPDIYIIDHFTGLGWYKNRGGNDTIDDALTIANDPALTLAGFTGDWRLPSIEEHGSIRAEFRHYGETSVFHQFPFTWDLTNMGTCSVQSVNTLKAYYTVATSGEYRPATITSTSIVITYVRNHF